MARAFSRGWRPLALTNPSATASVSVDLVRFRRLQVGPQGTLACTDLAPGGLAELARRLALLLALRAELGLQRLELTLVDAGYPDDHLGQHQLLADGSCSHQSAAALNYVVTAATPQIADVPSDPGGQALAQFLRNLQAWVAQRQVRLPCLLTVARSVRDVLQLRAQGQLQPSHLVVAYGAAAEADARAVAATAHPEGYFELHTPDLSRSNLCGYEMPAAQPPAPVVDFAFA